MIIFFKVIAKIKKEQQSWENVTQYAYIIKKSR